MQFSIKNTLLFVFFGTILTMPQNQLEGSVKAVFWSKPSVFYQNRFAIVKKIGFFSSLWNAMKASDAQNQLLDKLSHHFGVQTQPYKANDPDTNKPLPLIMRQWLTGEKSAHDIRHSAQKIFKNDSFMPKVIDIVFTPNELIKVTSVLEDGYSLVEAMNKQVKQILASNYDPASFKELQSSAIGKRVLPRFHAIYNSGTLKDNLKGLVLQDPGFFKLIMHEQHLQPQECLVINTDPDVINAAKSLGMLTIEYKHNDFNFVKNELKKIGLIP